MNMEKSLETEVVKAILTGKIGTKATDYLDFEMTLQMPLHQNLNESQLAFHLLSNSVHFTDSEHNYEKYSLNHFTNFLFLLSLSG